MAKSTTVTTSLLAVYTPPQFWTIGTVYLSLILKRITFHKSVRWFVLQSHFDTTSNLYDDLSFEKCIGHALYVND